MIFVINPSFYSKKATHLERGANIRVFGKD
jgi:hypothetical protein